MCALACLMTSDLLSLEQIFVFTQSRLHQLSEGPPGAVANKATKLLRQFEALTRGSQPLKKPEATSRFSDFSLSSTDSSEPAHPSLLSPSAPVPPPGAPQSCAEAPEVPVRPEDSGSSSRLSLFSGMELVTKPRPVCVVPLSEDLSSPEENTEDAFRTCPEENTDPLTDETTDSGSQRAPSDETQTLSAFSFLNS